MHSIFGIPMIEEETVPKVVSPLSLLVTFADSSIPNSFEASNFFQSPQLFFSGAGTSNFSSSNKPLFIRVQLRSFKSLAVITENPNGTQKFVITITEKPSTGE